MEIDSLEVRIKSSADSAIGSLDRLQKKLLASSRTLGQTSATLDQMSNKVYKFSDAINKMPEFNKQITRSNSSLRATSYELMRINSYLHRLTFPKVTNMSIGMFGRGGSSSFVSNVLKSMIAVRGLAAAFRGLSSSIDIASSMTEVENVVNMSFGQYRDKLDAFTQISREQFGMSKLFAKQTASTYQAMANAMGISLEKASDMSVQLTGLAGDLASFYDKPLDTVSKDLESVYTGTLQPLKKYGIALTQATLKEYALSKGLDGNIKELSQAEKAMLRYQYVMDATRQAQGDFQRTSDSFHNQLTILKSGLQDLALPWGTILINAFKPVLSYLNFVLQQFTSFSVQIANALGTIFGWKVEIQNVGIAEDFENAEDSLGGAASNAKKLKNNLMGIDELNVLSDNGGGGGSGGGGVSAEKTEPAFKIAETESLFDSNIKDLYSLGRKLSDTLGDVLSKIDWDVIHAKAKDFGTELANFLNGTLKLDTFRIIGRTLGDVLNTVIYSELSFSEQFNWTKFGRGIALSLNSFFETSNWEALGLTLSSFSKGLLRTIDRFVRNLNTAQIAQALVDVINNIDFKGIFSEFKKVLEDIGAAIDSFIRTINASDIGGVAIAIESIGAALLAFTGVIGVASVIMNVAISIGELTSAIAAMTGVSAAEALLMVATAAGEILAVAGVVAVLTGLAVAGIQLGNAVRDREEIEKYGTTIDGLAYSMKTASENINDTIEVTRKWQTTGSAQLELADDLADKYFELAEKENKTSDEMKMLESYASRLSSVLPGFNDIIADGTKSFDEQKQAVDDLIESQKEYYKVRAYENSLIELYEEQIEAEKEYKDALHVRTQLYGDLHEAQREYSRLIREGENGEAASSERLGEMVAKIQDLQIQIDKTSEPFFNLKNNMQDLTAEIDSVNQSIADSTLKLKDIGNEAGSEYVNEASNAIASSDSQSAVANSTSLLFSGSTDAASKNGAEQGKNYVVGAAEGIAENASTAVTEVSNLTGDINTALHDGLGNGSPSVIAHEQGKFYIEGLANGLASSEGLSLVKNSISTICDAIKTGFDECLKDTISQTTVSIDELMNLFQEKMGAEVFSGLFEEIRTTMTDSITELSEYLIEAFTVFDEETLIPFFSYDKWYEMAQNFYNAITDTWLATDAAWMTNMDKWFKVGVEPNFDLKKWTKYGKQMQDGIFTGFKGIAASIKSILDAILQAFASALNQVVDNVNRFIKKLLKSLGEFAPSSLKTIDFHFDYVPISVPAFTTGGFPEDGLFMANHNELVGEFSNGKTAVANNEQIISGIEGGVERAVNRLIAPYLDRIANTNETIANKEMNVNIGDREIAIANARGQAELGLTLVTV